MDNAVVTLCNERLSYVQAAMSLFYSAKNYGKWQGKYVLLGYKLSSGTIDMFESRGVKVVNITQDVFPNIRGRHRHDEFSRIVYCKYLLFSDHFKDYGKTIFFDADSMVLDDISPLLEVKTFGACCYKSFDFTFKEAKDCYGTNNHMPEYQELHRNYDTESKLFGAGTMVIDNSLVKDENYQALLDLTGKYGHLSSLPEESILNLFALGLDRTNLDFNYDHVVTGKLKASGKVKVVHVLHPKPWEGQSAYHERFEDNHKKFLYQFQGEGFKKLHGFTKL